MTSMWRRGYKTVQANIKFRQRIQEYEDQRLDRTFIEKPAKQHDSTISAPTDEDEEDEGDATLASSSQSEYHGYNDHQSYQTYGANGPYPCPDFANNDAAQPQSGQWNTSSHYAQAHSEQSQNDDHRYHSQDSYDSQHQSPNCVGPPGTWSQLPDFGAAEEVHWQQSQEHRNAYDSREHWGDAAIQQPSLMPRAYTMHGSGHYQQLDPPPPAHVMRRQQTYTAGEHQHEAHGGGDFEDVINSPGAIRARLEAQNRSQINGNQHGQWNYQ